MKSSLQNSNPWLLEPGRRAELLRVSAASSSAIESIVKPFVDKPARHAQEPAALAAREVRFSTRLKQTCSGA